jgi:hypothetical protein
MQPLSPRAAAHLKALYEDIEARHTESAAERELDESYLYIEPTLCSATFEESAQVNDQDISNSDSDEWHAALCPVCFGAAHDTTLDCPQWSKRKAATPVVEERPILEEIAAAGTWRYMDDIAVDPEAVVGVLLAQEPSDG